MVKKYFIPKSLLIEAEYFDKTAPLPANIKADATSPTGYVLEHIVTSKNITPETKDNEDNTFTDVQKTVKTPIADKSYILNDKEIITSKDLTDNYQEIKEGI